LGPEEVTRDIPNMSEYALRNLDEVGIVNVGVSVKAGDILVGKVMPQSESPLTAEEKLLRAIFGEKSSDVKNYSLRMPPGEEGTVVSVKILTKRGVQKDQRALAIEKAEIAKLIKEKQDKIHLVEQQLLRSINTMNNTSLKNLTCYAEFSTLNIGKLDVDNTCQAHLSEMRKFHDQYVGQLNDNFSRKVEKLQSGDDLQQGILKSVKVFVASKI
jgi:DNA-directed RNA polymerase subunit beta